MPQHQQLSLVFTLFLSITTPFSSSPPPPPLLPLCSCLASLVCSKCLQTAAALRGRRAALCQMRPIRNRWVALVEHQCGANDHNMLSQPFRGVFSLLLSSLHFSSWFLFNTNSCSGDWYNPRRVESGARVKVYFFWHMFREIKLENRAWKTRNETSNKVLFYN